MSKLARRPARDVGRDRRVRSRAFDGVDCSERRVSPRRDGGRALEAGFSWRSSTPTPSPGRQAAGQFLGPAGAGRGERGDAAVLASAKPYGRRAPRGTPARDRRRQACGLTDIDVAVRSSTASTARSVRWKPVNAIRGGWAGAASSATTLGAASGRTGRKLGARAVARGDAAAKGSLSVFRSRKLPISTPCRSNSRLVRIIDGRSRSDLRRFHLGARSASCARISTPGLATFKSRAEKASGLTLSSLASTSERGRGTAPPIPDWCCRCVRASPEWAGLRPNGRPGAADPHDQGARALHRDRPVRQVFGLSLSARCRGLRRA